MTDQASKIAVLGAGSWGTALAVLLARNGHAVRLWGHDPAHMSVLRSAHSNATHLPGIRFPKNLSVETDLRSAIDSAVLLVVAVPSHAFRGTLQKLADLNQRLPTLIYATKGLEAGTGRYMHEVSSEVLGSRIVAAILSGPSFAVEVAQNLPTAVTVAAVSMDDAMRLTGYFHNESFRVYGSDDVLGVEIGGAIKNVLAIAAGISDGLGFGANARAALVTRGLAEMMRFGIAQGAKRETFMGLAGVGDLVLTCTDDKSRNRRLGLLLGQGASLQDARRRIGQEIEGVSASKEIYGKASAGKIDLPIVTQVYRILYEGSAPRDAVHELLSREPKEEFSRQLS